MQLVDIRQQLSDATGLDLDNARGESPSTSDLNKQINWGYRIIARKCSIVGEAALTLVLGQSLYNIRDITTPVVTRKIIRPLIIYINKRPLLDAANRDYGLWSYNELARIYPNWKLDSNNPVRRAVFMSHDTLLLHPASDATTVAQVHSVYGQYLPNDLVIDTDAPALPEEIHEAIGWLAAQVAATPVISEQEGWERLQKYSDYWTQIIQDVADQNKRTMLSGGSTKGYYSDDLIAL